MDGEKMRLDSVEQKRCLARARLSSKGDLDARLASADLVPLTLRDGWVDGKLIIVLLRGFSILDSYWDSSVVVGVDFMN